MIYLLLSIVCSTAIFLLFKVFGKLQLNTFQAIVANYFVAAVFGLLLCPDPGLIIESISEPWVPLGYGLGLLFIFIFYLMAFTSQNVGVSAASVATKMSLVLSMLFFVITDPDEGLTIWKIIGVILAIPGVYLASMKQKDQTVNLKLLVFPLIIFVGSAVIDTAIGYSEKHYLTNEIEQSAFASLPFLGAFSLGIIILLFKRYRMGEKFSGKSFIGGLVLGVVNYGSILFLIRAFDADLLDRSALIPVNNLGVVVLSSLGAILIFSEKLSLRNKLGIALSVLALLILLIPG